MMDGIGTMAGKVWRYLNQNGEVTTARMIRELGGTRDAIERAIGWLAREDKIVVEKSHRAERIRLR